MRNLPVDEGQLYTSVSQIKTWLTCPRKFELRYVRGAKPDFRPLALAFGTAFHAAAGRFFSELKDTGAAPQLEALTETFRDAWGRELTEEVLNRPGFPGGSRN